MLTKRAPERRPRPPAALGGPGTLPCAGPRARGRRRRRRPEPGAAGETAAGCACACACRAAAPWAASACDGRPRHLPPHAPYSRGGDLDAPLAAPGRSATEPAEPAAALETPEPAALRLTPPHPRHPPASLPRGLRGRGGAGAGSRRGQPRVPAVLAPDLA